MIGNLVRSLTRGSRRNIASISDVAVYCQPARGEQSLPGGIRNPRCRFLSSRGTFDADGASIDDSAHYMSRLDPKCETAVVFKWSIPIAPSTSLAEVLIAILAQLGGAGCLYIEVATNWVDADWARRMLPGCSVDMVSSKSSPDEDGAEKKVMWLCIRPGGRAITMDSGAGIYGRLLRKQEAFRDFYDDFVERHSAANENSFGLMFSYGMSWTLVARAVFDQCVRGFDVGRPLRGVDFGGAQGFLDCELASMGHRLTNVEIFEERLEVMDWIAAETGVSDRVDGIHASMEAIGDLGDLGSVDFVCFINSLVCLDRDAVGPTIQAASKMLASGGFILLRENVSPEPQRVDRLVRFSHRELREILADTGGDLVFYNHLGMPLDANGLEKVGAWFVAIRFD